MRLTAGLIGYGERGTTLASIINNHVPEVALIAVAEPVTKRADLAKAKGYKVFADEKSLLNGCLPDIMIIATNPPLHCEQVVMAAEAECHIFVEKPLAISPQEADIMVKAVRDAGVVCTVDFETVFADSFHVLQAYLGSEGFGKLIRFDATDKGRPPAYDIETCMPHYLHALMLLTNSRPVEVFARVIVDGRKAVIKDVRPINELYPQGRTHDIGMRADMIEASYLFENGVIARFFLAALDEEYVTRAGVSSGKAGSEFMKLVCYGTRGQIKFHQTETGLLYVKHVPEDTLDEMQWEPVPSMWKRDATWVVPTTHIMQDFVEAIKTRRNPRVTIEDAAFVGDMTYGMYASHLAGKPIALPLTNRMHPLVG